MSDPVSPTPPIPPAQDPLRDPMPPPMQDPPAQPFRDPVVPPAPGPGESPLPAGLRALRAGRRNIALWAEQDSDG